MSDGTKSKYQLKQKRKRSKGPIDPRWISRIPDPKAPGFTYRDERSTPVAEEFKEARRAKRRKQLPKLPTDIDTPVPYVLTNKAYAALAGIDTRDYLHD